MSKAASNTIKISIIIPCYNAEGKIHKCIQSLNKIEFPENEHEVIFIDDASSDRTREIVTSEIKNHPNWFLEPLNKNSGSPSEPRNKGISLAKGNYLFFLDSDDEILEYSLRKLYDLAQKENACIVRGSLTVDDNGDRIIRNQIKNFKKSATKSTKIKQIIKYQSTTPPALIKTKVIIDNKISWDKTIRMGEDTLFLIDVLLASKNISYFDKPIYIYNKTVEGEASSTQVYGQRELKNHLFVWEKAEERLSQAGFSYFDSRGKIALQTTFKAIMSFYQNDIDEDLFNQFSSFVNTHSKTVNKIKIGRRFTLALQHLQNNNYLAFFEELKPHLLIAGADLKFIIALIPDLKKQYDVKIDEWTGHNTHNESQSKSLLKWADIIFCEWLLGNAVWYSQRKKKHQKLIVRLHRFELTREFGHQINDENVDWYCTVGVYILEKMLETFKFSRGKVRLVSNFIETGKYLTSTEKNKVFNIGIVGILPSRKGYLTALTLLYELQKKDTRYNLNVFGRMPEELSWVIKDKKEKEYFKNCNEYISEHNLNNKVHIKGWVDTKTVLKDIGFVLSVSSNKELVESFHIAPAEAFMSGNQGIFLYWDGVEYLYPDKYIFQTLADMTDYITHNSNLAEFNQNAKVGHSFVQENYNTVNFINSFNSMVKENYNK